MLNLRNMNPMVRAVGTMGAVSALVGGITFAQLTSNTVALSPNTLSTGSANLEIGALSNNNHHHHNGGNNNENVSTDTTTDTTNSLAPDTTSNTNNTNHNNSCSDTTNGTIPGFNLTGDNGLLPGVESDALNFCLSNTSGVPLDLTATIPDDPFSSASELQPEDITLNITCDNGGSASDTLDNYVSPNTQTLGSLSANDTTNCEATVELSNSATISGTESLPSFDIEFTGTSS